MKGLLKFITCGSVDDGKSTLIDTFYMIQNSFMQTRKRHWSWIPRSEAVRVKSTTLCC